MIIQTTKRTVYYPAPISKATILLSGTRRALFFRARSPLKAGQLRKLSDLGRDGFRPFEAGTGCRQQ
jgi:hypothetical protein